MILYSWFLHLFLTYEDFIRKLLKVIEENLDKEELGSTLIADRMAMSSRQFYRKFKEVSNTAPGDLITVSYTHLDVYKRQTFESRIS